MKSLTVLVLALAVATAAFVGGYWTRTVSAQQSSDAGQATEKLPPDVHPETLARIEWATRDEFTSAEDLAAFDLLLEPEQVGSWFIPQFAAARRINGSFLFPIAR